MATLTLEKCAVCERSLVGTEVEVCTDCGSSMDDHKEELDKLADEYKLARHRFKEAEEEYEEARSFMRSAQDKMDAAEEALTDFLIKHGRSKEEAAEDIEKIIKAVPL